MSRGYQVLAFRASAFLIRQFVSKSLFRNFPRCIGFFVAIEKVNIHQEFYKDDIQEVSVLCVISRLRKLTRSSKSRLSPARQSDLRAMCMHRSTLVPYHVWTMQYP